MALALKPGMDLHHGLHMESSAREESDGLAINMVIRQDPFSITLDASALLAAAIMLIIGMHTLDRVFLEVMILAIPIVLLIRNDYHNFLNLGPGGTPATPAGYVRLAWYRLFALRDPFSPPPADPTLKPATGILQQQPLPYRPGPRPVVAGLAPQRQLNQAGNLQTYQALKLALEDFSARNPGKFVTATSCLEKHGFALFARRPLNVCGNGEICHIHTSERSLHMNLHPDDIKEVLEKGWGQRHPMAWKGWVYTPIPSTFVMIYAPRDESDLRIVLKIIEAAIWYTTTEKVDLAPPLE
ncbi:hypothetical protein VTK73DRAFT_8890 [Phialemonium thermophilum]|uniref:Luciferase domain-containing protein n=1 Tax=Phialemonium thermophilum TaxID=223376 RepID=A0ABR3XM67_9PEZI